jgi:hypothetical protein
MALGPKTGDPGAGRAEVDGEPAPAEVVSEGGAGGLMLSPELAGLGQLEGADRVKRGGVALVRQS